MIVALSLIAIVAEALAVWTSIRMVMVQKALRETHEKYSTELAQRKQQLNAALEEQDRDRHVLETQHHAMIAWLKESSTALSDYLAAIEPLETVWDDVAAKAKKPVVLDKAVEPITVREPDSKLISKLFDAKPAVQKTKAQGLSTQLQELARSITLAAGHAQEIEDLRQRANQSGTQVADLAGTAVHHSEEGYQAVHHTIDELELLKDLSSDVHKRIQTFSGEIQTVGGAVGLIEEIARRTNLLSLNASIVAVQAGEHGRGFQVIAQEVKALAEKTGASTKAIAAQISHVQEQSRDVLLAVESAVHAVNAGFQVAVGAGDALTRIRETAIKTQRRLQSMSRTMERWSDLSQSAFVSLEELKTKAADFARLAEHESSEPAHETKDVFQLKMQWEQLLSHLHEDAKSAVEDVIRQVDNTRHEDFYRLGLVLDDVMHKEAVLETLKRDLETKASDFGAS